MVARRNPIIHNKEGFQHIQLEDTPRKRKRQHILVTNAPVLSLDNPPKPDDAVKLALVPLDVLQGWGQQCGVPPSEVAPEALLAEEVPDVNVEDRSA